MFDYSLFDELPSRTNRRTILRIGTTLFGVSLPTVLAAQRSQADERSNREEVVEHKATPRAVNCILLWTEGGMSNVDTFDMKPEAPSEYRGEFGPIATNVSGIEVCEHLPRISERMDKLCLVKSIAHSESGDHAAASHYMLTGYPQRPDPTGQPAGSTIYPMFGSVVAKEGGWQNHLPPNVQLGGGVAYGGAGYIGSQFNPLIIRSDPNRADFRIEHVSIPDQIGPERTSRRRNMLERLDAWQQYAVRRGDVANRDRFYEQAFDLVTSPDAKRAFRLDDEPAKVRDCYGRTREGQATLLARRLIESGVRFVTVNFGGWDTHDRNFVRLKSPLLPTLDQAWSALLDDLDRRGLLDNTLVVCAGEFGRTPKVNGAAGRDHYAPCNVVTFSGAGVRMGQVVGRTDARCERVAGAAHSTMDYAATIYRLLGIDYTKEYRAEDSRPLLINNGGRPIAEALA